MAKSKVPQEAKLSIERLERAESLRSNFDNRFEDVADYVLDSRTFTTKRAPGTQRRRKIYDTTAGDSAELLTAALHTQMTNPSIRWMSLGLEDESMEAKREAKIFLQESSRRMLRMFSNPMSRFATSVDEVNMEYVSLGTCNMMVLAPTGPMVKFVPIPLGSTYLTENHMAEVEEVHRKSEMTASEIVRKWGDAASPKVKAAANDPRREHEKFEVVHDVYKREHRDPTQLDRTNKAWASLYVERDQGNLLDAGGFDYMPYHTPRWRKGIGEPYGFSQAMRVMRDIKMLQSMSKSMTIAWEKNVDPPIFALAGSVQGPMNTIPGGITWVKPGTSAFPQAMPHAQRVDMAFQALTDVRTRIEKAFFAHVLILPESDRMTATEILERIQQRMFALGPALSRYMAEMLTPAVITTFDIMLSKGLLPPVPDVLRGHRIRPTFLGPLALAQRGSEVTSFNQFMQVTAPLVNVDPMVQQNLDADEAYRGVAWMLNVSERFMKRKSDVETQRQQMAAQQQLAAQAQIAQTTASASKDFADAAATSGAA